MVVEPRDAATIILVRNRMDSKGAGMEVLMVLRNRKSDFVPDSYVFPGGGMVDGDITPEIGALCSGMDCERAAHILGDLSAPEKALGIWVTGIRETFEEVGLMIACRKDGLIVSIDKDDEIERFRRYRCMLRDEEISFFDILEKEELTLAADRLHYYSHWITPEASPKRYDTRFFVARAPSNQKAFHDGVELTQYIWITPKDALEAFRKGTFNMVIPTMITLEELSGFDRVEDAIRSTRDKNITTNCIKVEIDEIKGIIVYTPDGRAFKHMPPSVE
ncbi:MAG: NUDIX hydrolase [Thermodesulfobacteriota bacterium]|nr:NUDIX hydrolase [Thermodesulfobacteriota bacterium]